MERSRIMGFIKRILVVASLVVVVSAFVPSVKAAGVGEVNWQTEVIFKAPVQVGNLVLDPGTYEFQLTDGTVARNVISIYSVDQRHWVGMVMGINVARTDISSMTGFTFENLAKGAPNALEYWYYPGWNRGIKLLYSQPSAIHKMAAVIASSAR
jgi:hypothetical protein